ncbi:MAG: T9SS type A sorting domain-containing protein [Chitinophagales bacterium]
MNPKSWALALRYCCALCCCISAQAQFAPPAGQPGTTAIPQDTPIIIQWAGSCSIQRGLRQINLPDSGYATVGDSVSAVGPAGTNGVVSLGDGGKATLGFSPAISDGTGFDFCVFENSFLDDFLELAVVAVSSDGVHFVRFPATSLTQDTLQTESFGLTDARKINNLAGKYRGGFGTPFDLNELRDSSGIDIQHITHVRITDVVGSIDSSYATRDAFGHKINDPWPTNFPSGGFDLDAVGVLAHWPTGFVDASNHKLQIFPNPVHHQLHLSATASNLCLYDDLGRLVARQQYTRELWLGELPRGLYWLKCTIDEQDYHQPVILE